MFAVRPMFAGAQVVNPLDCQGVTYLATRAGAGSANVTLTVNTNGTWSISGWPTLYGSPTSGFWHTGGGNTSMYVRFTRTASTGNGSSPSTGWLQMSANQQISCSSSASTAPMIDADSGTYTIEFSYDAATPVSTTTGVVLSTQVDAS